MSDSKDFASLSPKLLARKGGAKPAMRPQVQPLVDFHHDAVGRAQEELGWNDMGEGADVVPLSGPAVSKKARRAATPEVVISRETLARTIAQTPHNLPSAPAKGKRAAFTLRIDADRHFRLRLACAATNRSAQQLLTDALDAMLADMPEVHSMATQIRKRS